MEVKIDTKEKFHIVTPISTTLDDILTEKLSSICLHFLETDTKNVVINLSFVDTIAPIVPELWGNLYQHFMESDASLVFCMAQPKVKKVLEEEELLDALNITPTESEAWDIVQMEEMERDMFGDELGE